jgi:hypothetical protein
MAERFRSAMTKNDLITADLPLTAGVFMKLGEYKVQAGELVTIGYGQESGQESAQGRIYMDLKTSASAVIAGTVRLQAYSPQNRPMVVLGEWRTEVLSQGNGDRTKQVPLPEQLYWLSEDKKLFLEFSADAAATLAKAQSTVLIDTTEETV